MRAPEILSQLKFNRQILPPLAIRSLDGIVSTGADAEMELGWQDADSSQRFAVVANPQSTPQAIALSVRKAMTAAKPGTLPLIMVPYLSSDRIEELERLQVSGVDLCGNGIVVVPNRWLVKRTGLPNLYPESRGVNNPFRGRSALVGRFLLQQPILPSLTALHAGIQAAGGDISIAQVSKVLTVLQEELIVTKSKSSIKLLDRVRLLDSLADEWRRKPTRSGLYISLPSRDSQWWSDLSADPTLSWVVTGASSVARYATFAQAGPWRLAVSDVAKASSVIKARSSTVSNFADLELVELDDPGYAFSYETDPEGIRWASRLQTWLELQAGDARQAEVAVDIRDQLIGSLP